jgi:PAS domain S-box-containing protein
MTGEKLAWELLKESENRMSVLINNIKTAILYENEEQKVILANKTFCDMFHLCGDPAELAGQDHKNYAENNKNLFEKPDEYVDRVNDLLQKKTEVVADELCLTDGRIINRDYIPVMFNNQYKGHLWMYTDVTAEKKHAKTVKIQVEKYRNIIANMNLGLMEVDLDDLITSVNDIFCDISGYTKEELIGKRSLEILRSADNEKIIEKKVKLRQHGFLDVFQIPIKKNNGDNRWWLVSDAPNHDEDGNIIGSIGIHMDISDQKTMEHELSLAKQKAEDSSKAKETFLANMSHEIRTPMTGILGIANLLAKTELNEQQKKFTKLISESANNLLTIVNDVLDIEKISAGKLDLELIPFRLEDKVFTTLQSFQFKAEDKNINLLLKNALPPELVIVGDPFRLGQILNNLLSNALKFTQEGEISINMDCKQEMDDQIAVEFQVQDTGIGIGNERLGEIFHPFVQATSDTTRKYGGTGLGLTICKNLVEMQGGKITVDSTLNEGTVFSFYIPYKKGDKSMLVEEPIGDLDFKDLESIKILVAEDVELNQFLIKHILGAWGCDITVVNNGKEAVEKVERQSFDLILMDIQMPEMDGISATKLIRQMHASDKSLITKKIRTLNARDRSNIPIIALTANALKGDGQHYMDIGMNGYITKPYTEEKLFQVITQVIKTNETLKRKITPVHAPQTSAPPEPEEHLYDLSLINSIGKDDPAFTKKFITLFTDNMQDSIAGLVIASEERNFAAISKIAHKMKSNIDSMGIASLKQPIRDLESADPDGNDHELLVEKVITTLQIVFSQLKKLL